MVKLLISLLIFASLGWGDMAAFVEQKIAANPLVWAPYKVAAHFIHYNSKLNAQKLRVKLFSAKHLGQDVIVVFKGDRLLYYVKDGQIVRDQEWSGFTYNFPVKVALGSRPSYWTPEGEYYICRKNPNSQFIKFLGISYPNNNDAKKGLESGMLTPNQYKAIVQANAEKKGPPWYTPLGGRFGVHSAPTWMKPILRAKEKQNPDVTWVTRKDFTEGCVGVENRIVEYLFANVPEGTPILLLP